MLNILNIHNVDMHTQLVSHLSLSMDLPTPAPETALETSARHTSITTHNASAMTLLSQASYDAAFTKLKKALSLSTPSMYGKSVDECLLRATTFNNMGILYKR